MPKPKNATSSHSVRDNTQANLSSVLTQAYSSTIAVDPPPIVHSPPLPFVGITQGCHATCNWWVNATVASSLDSSPVSLAFVDDRAMRLLTFKMPLAPQGLHYWGLKLAFVLRNSYFVYHGAVLLLRRSRNLQKVIAVAYRTSSLSEWCEMSSESLTITAVDSIR